MNASDYSLHVFEVISGGKPDSVSPALRSSIELGLPEALSELAGRVYRSGRRAILEKTYSGTLTSGAVDLTAGAFADLWFVSLKTAYVTYPVANGVVPIEFYENSRDIDLPGVAGLYRSTLRGNAYLVRDENGDAPPNATVTIVASRIPVIAELAALNLDQDIIEIGAARTLRGLRGEIEDQAQEVA